MIWMPRAIDPELLKVFVQADRGMPLRTAWERARSPTTWANVRRSYKLHVDAAAAAAAAAAEPAARPTRASKPIGAAAAPSSESAAPSLRLGPSAAVRFPVIFVSTPPPRRPPTPSHPAPSRPRPSAPRPTALCPPTPCPPVSRPPLPYGLARSRPAPTRSPVFRGMARGWRGAVAWRVGAGWPDRGRWAGVGLARGGRVAGASRTRGRRGAGVGRAWG